MPMDQLQHETSEMARERDPSPPRKKQSALKKIVSVFRNKSKMEVGSVPPPLCFQETNEESPNGSPKVVRRRFRNKRKERSTGDISVWRPKVCHLYCPILYLLDRNRFRRCL